MEVVARRRLSSNTVKLPQRSSARDSSGSRVGPYRVLAALARGGTASVHLAEDPDTGERVALKMLDPYYAGHPAMVERLLAERTISASARHDGLLDVRGSGRCDDGIPYVVMEYLDGENLNDLVGRAPLSVDGIVAIAAQIAVAIAALHAAGVIHGDIKAHNIVVLYERGLSGWPRIKVIDYGVSRRLTDGPLVDGTIAGTPACMAPEQWRGALGLKSDVYGLGCLLFELITNQPLFSGSLPQLMTAHCEHMPDRPSARGAVIPAQLERLIVRALAKDPAMRPTMADMQAELTALSVDATARDLVAAVS